jgi:hypothetical protein
MQKYTLSAPVLLYDKCNIIFCQNNKNNKLNINQKIISSCIIYTKMKIYDKIITDVVENF